MTAVVRAKWTDEILDEVFHNILKIWADLTADWLARSRQKMSEAIRDDSSGGATQPSRADARHLRERPPPVVRPIDAASIAATQTVAHAKRPHCADSSPDAPILRFKQGRLTSLERPSVPTSTPSAPYPAAIFTSLNQPDGISRSSSHTIWIGRSPDA